MRPMRGFNRGGGGFGDMFPSLDSMAAKLAIAFVGISALFLATSRGQGGLLLLNPADVILRFRVWELVTYAFVATGALGILFGGLIIFSIGGFLESTWGGKRLLLVAVGIPFVAGLITTALALVMPMSVYAGGSVMTAVLWVAYGLVIGKGQTNFWGIPLTGNWFAAIGAGFTVLNMLTAGSWRAVAPEIFGLVLVFVYVRGASPKRLMLQLQHWRLQRQLRDRSKHLRVVDRNRPSDRDQFLN
ncbi:rhomboid family intramembrane serine protease [Corallococcus exiguus]|nr:rhomboid family intramembrane serine protease [Corallococcus sp. AB032C]NNB96998.1 rhomboid family intramembrane serine protease [Corallococcus exiguus]NNC04049.1 rhomboid family intramembrane serine protease [Corallococcus exiguus]NPC48304.1 rhomboid family intramembrane serine protease [Corallococcus exiguus]RKH78546.1 rhomboid family intramembrane serine protease [Corallococcus sp. AB032C]